MHKIVLTVAPDTSLWLYCVLPETTGTRFSIPIYLQYMLENCLMAMDSHGRDGSPISATAPCISAATQCNGSESQEAFRLLRNHLSSPPVPLISSLCTSPPPNLGSIVFPINCSSSRLTGGCLFHPRPCSVVLTQVWPTSGSNQDCK